MSAEDLAELGRQLELSQAALAKLRETAAEIVQQIRATEALPLAERRLRRKQRIAALNKISGAFGKVAAALDEFPHSAEPTLDQLLHADLGRLVSSTGFRVLLGMELDASFSTRDLDSRAFNSRGGPAPAIEAEMLFRRQAAARGRSKALLSRFVARVRAALTQELEAERQNRGGNPGQVYRRFVIQALESQFQALTGDVAVTTPAGRFALLCSGVLESIGSDTTGLDQAIARELSRVRLLRGEDPD
jgi:hypothetical protein